ncbi:MAG TPA: aromatic ring-hydroxylating dioxygenase subunit alpha [Gemmatimonadales bacterium]|nr:aromatic ring-hydroxylating dioxygenase subunit alpha [Gemmatimonadales bacterium]
MSSPHSPLEPTLLREYYFSPEIFGKEKERIFFGQWMCVGREEEVPNPGDYLLLDVVGESVVLVRTREGKLAAHYNVCRHRGSQLVLGVDPKPRRWADKATGDKATSGPSGTFTSGIKCPYHSWTYELSGSLRTAPFLDQGSGFRKDQLPLHSVDVDVWGGFVFLRLGSAESGSRNPESLSLQLGSAADRTKRYPLTELRIARRIGYEVEANWKVILENYNECYHCGGVHPELCKVVPAFKQKGGMDLDWDRGVPHREGAWTFTMSGTTNRKPFAGLNEDEQTRHKGELLYPNFMLSLSAEHAAAFTLWPTSPNHTTILCDFLFHPSEIAQSDFNPNDAVEFWDITNRQDWVICESVQRGMASRVFRQGFYAPMESMSLDIRRYIRERLD